LIFLKQGNALTRGRQRFILDGVPLKLIKINLFS
jgi:hypothetical protein